MLACFLFILMRYLEWSINRDGGICSYCRVILGTKKTIIYKTCIPGISQISIHVYSIHVYIPNMDTRVNKEAVNSVPHWKPILPIVTWAISSLAHCLAQDLLMVWSSACWRRQPQRDVEPREVSGRTWENLRTAWIRSWSLKMRESWVRKICLQSASKQLDFDKVEVLVL